MTDDSPRRLWSESDLDEALSALHNEIDLDTARFADTRTALLRAADPAASAAPITVLPPRREHGRRWPALFGAVAAVIALAGATAVGIDAVRPTPAASDHEASVYKIKGVDPVLGPGQYLYIADRRWRTYSHPDTKVDNFQVEALDETWSAGYGAPDFGGTSMMTGGIRWLPGTAKRKGYDRRTPPAPGALWAADSFSPFFEMKPDPARYDQAWRSPTRDFLNALPKTPLELLNRLESSVPVAGDASEVFWLAGTALETGLYPAEIRTRVYQALLRLPAVHVNGYTTTFDGRTGVEISLTTVGRNRQVLIVDEATGQLIGSRTTAVRTPDSAIEPGEVIEESALTYGVSAKYGERPAG